MEFKVRLPKAWSRRRKYIKVGGELHNKVKKLEFQGLSRRKGRLLLGKQRERVWGMGALWGAWTGWGATECGTL